MFYNFIQISFNNILYTITCTHGLYPKVHGVFAEGMAAENDCGGAEASQSWRACFCSSGLYCNDVRREGREITYLSAEMCGCAGADNRALRATWVAIPAYAVASTNQPACSMYARRAARRPSVASFVLQCNAQLLCV